MSKATTSGGQLSPPCSWGYCMPGGTFRPRGGYLVVCQGWYEQSNLDVIPLLTFYINTGSRLERRNLRMRYSVYTLERSADG